MSVYLKSSDPQFSGVPYSLMNEPEIKDPLLNTIERANQLYQKILKEGSKFQKIKASHDLFLMCDISENSMYSDLLIELVKLENNELDIKGEVEALRSKRAVFKKGLKKIQLVLLLTQINASLSFYKQLPELKRRLIDASK